jgi:hypothetical protein
MPEEDRAGDPRLPQHLGETPPRLHLEEGVAGELGPGIGPAEPEAVENEPFAAQCPAEPFGEVPPERDGAQGVVEEDDRREAGPGLVGNNPPGFDPPLGKADRNGHACRGVAGGLGHPGILAGTFQADKERGVAKSRRRTGD